jgi:hypothetical protein
MSPRRRPVTLILLCLVFWTLTTHGKYSNTGDEPHYLMVAQSLWADGDLDLANNYALNQGAIFGAAGLQHELHAIPARDGALRPVHDIGVAVALVPAYAIATGVASITSPGILTRFRMNPGLFAYALISLVIIGIVVLAASATITALIARGLSPNAAGGTVFVFWSTMPILANAYEIFPEPFALLITAWAVREWTAPAKAFTRQTWGLVAALGFLPWFHRKYFVYAFALLVVVLWGKREAVLRLSRGAQIGAAVLFVAPMALLAMWTFHYWGNIGGPLTLDGAPFSFSTFIDGAPGLFVDRENGLFWWAPLCWLAPAAFSLEKGRRLWLLPVAALVLPAAAHDQWWAGFSPACRFLVPLMPIVCVVGADLLRSRTGRVALFAALVPQILIAAYGWQHPHDLWPHGDGHNRVLGALAGGIADSLLPSFRVAGASPWPRAALALGVIASLNVFVAIRCRRATADAIRVSS